mmetsp:Transcript_41821/g.91254  ORF Transcript_41821/g.91254 Transcript_41821/m.91254 type:complete len:674 (-) Transcript_41821:104-2125(-)
MGFGRHSGSETMGLTTSDGMRTGSKVSSRSVELAGADATRLTAAPGSHGLLSDPETYSKVLGRHLRLEDVGGLEPDKSPSIWAAVGFGLCARLPFLHSVGISIALVFILPKHFPLLGIWLSVLLVCYGMVKSFFTGIFAFRGAWSLIQQEKRMRMAKFSREVQITDKSASREELLKHEVLPLHGQQATDSLELEAQRSFIGDELCGTSLLCPLGPKRGQRIDDPDEVFHCVLIPCYREAASTIAATLRTLSEQSVASHIVVVIAMEARDEQAEETARQLRAQFRENVAEVLYTLHPLGSGEVPGKSSNENWGFRCAKRWLCDVKGLHLDQIIFTTCDADTYFHPQHFEYLTHLFLTSDNPHGTVWQSAVCFLPNTAELPTLCAVRYALLGVGFLGQLANPISPTGTFPFAVYSISARLAHEAGYWDPTVVPEDWHMFFRLNLECTLPRNGVALVPMYVAVGCLGVEAPTRWQTYWECYKQAVRWQFGGIDLAYLLVQLFSSPGSLMRKLSLIVGLWEQHLLSPIMWVAIVSSRFLYRQECLFVDSIPSISVPDEATTLCPVGGVRVHDALFRVWVVFVLGNWASVLVLDWTYRCLVAGRTHFERVPQGVPSLKRAFSFLLFPILDVFLFVIPTFHAHTQMFISTHFNYVVAPKKRSPTETEMPEKCLKAHDGT